jgi:hypothetical protein
VSLGRVYWWTPIFTPRVCKDITALHKRVFLLYGGKARTGGQTDFTADSDWFSIVITFVLKEGG